MINDAMIVVFSGFVAVYFCSVVVDNERTTNERVKLILKISNKL